MGISISDFKTYIVHPVLSDFNLEHNSDVIEHLLIFTAIQESNLGSCLHFKQGLGIYQITSDYHRKIWDTFLADDPEMASKIRGYASQWHFLTAPDIELATNLSYATLIAWCIYRFNHAQFPSDSRLISLHQCWHNHYPSLHKSTDMVA